VTCFPKDSERVRIVAAGEHRPGDHRPALRPVTNATAANADSNRTTRTRRLPHRSQRSRAGSSPGPGRDVEAAGTACPESMERRPQRPHSAQIIGGTGATNTAH